MSDISRVLVTSQEIDDRLTELAAQIDADYGGKQIVLVGVLNGAVMVMADLARHLKSPISMDWMAISSYGSGSKSSGVVRILKDLSTDLYGKDVLVVEDIVDTGLTLSYLIQNLKSREPKSVEVMAMFRKPEAVTTPVDVKYLGFDIPNEFVVGYGLDWNDQYRNLRDLAALSPHVYRG